jgi:hypothetical protein
LNFFYFKTIGTVSGIRGVLIDDTGEVKTIGVGRKFHFGAAVTRCKIIICINHIALWIIDGQNCI